MKKSIFATLALSALFLGSCSSEDNLLPANDGKVTFVAQLPGSMSRDYSDGLKATQLTYAVYDAETDQLIVKSGDQGAPTATFNNRTATLSLDLVKGKTYNVVFWADVPGNTAYTFNATDKTISVDYSGIKMGDENRDAFFQVEKNVAINGPITKTVELRRPFGQLNWGTDDKDKAAAAQVNVTSAEVTVSNVYNTLNLFTGVASGASQMTFAKNTLPAESAFPGGGYDYLAMDYILTGVVLEDQNDVQKAQSEVLTNCTLTVYDDNDKAVNTINVSNVPVQRNYRTNIVGSLLTSTVDYTIIVVPDYYDDPHQYSSLLLAAQNGGSVVLFDDVDLEGVHMTIPAGKSLIVDLNGHTISNACIVTKGALTIKGDGFVTAIPAVDDDNYPVIWCAPGGNVTIEGGRFIGTAIPGNTDTNRNPVVVYAQGAEPLSGVSQDANVTIKGGTFKAPEYAGVLNERNNEYSHITVTGGTFYRENPEDGDDVNQGSYLPEGYCAVASEDGGVAVYTVHQGVAPTTAAELRTALLAGGNVYLNADVNLTSTIRVTKNVNLDLNGHKVFVPKTVGSGWNDALYFLNGNSVVKNGSIECEDTGKSDVYGNPIWAALNANVTLENVDITGLIAVYVAQGGAVTINSGTFHGPRMEQAVYVASTGGSVTINGGEFDCSLCDEGRYTLNLADALNKTGKPATDYISVKGGTFKGYNPAESHSENPAVSFVPDGYQSVETSTGVWTVSAK